MNLRIHHVMIVLVLGLCACLTSDDFGQGNVRYSFFDFTDGLQNWSAGIAGHSIEESQENLLEVSHSSLPTLFNDSKALKIRAKIDGEKIFMFIKRQVHGLDPNANYQIVCEVRLGAELLTETDRNSNAEVLFKYGSSSLEPMVSANVDEGIYALNLNAMSREVSGGEIKTVQKINPPVSRQMPAVHTVNTFNIPLQGSTDAEGKLWILMGTESDLQSELAFYYNAIVIYYTRM
ncbi:MAG: hypothetical protein JJU28_20180 [Cyclobacteriaceae bacterium]|nr:hypothetical protein [Cyclobacteriaceae bacterium]